MIGPQQSVARDDPRLAEIHKVVVIEPGLVEILIDGPHGIEAAAKYPSFFGYAGAAGGTALRGADAQDTAAYAKTFASAGYEIGNDTATTFEVMLKAAGYDVVRVHPPEKKPKIIFRNYRAIGADADAALDVDFDVAMYSGTKDLALAPVVGLGIRLVDLKTQREITSGRYMCGGKSNWVSEYIPADPQYQFTGYEAFNSDFAGVTAGLHSCVQAIADKFAAALKLKQTQKP